MRYLTPFEERLVELVHLLAAGTPEEYGFTLHEVKQFLIKKSNKKDTNPLKSLEEDDRILQELKKYLQS
jgi:hypothetical protein